MNLEDILREMVEQELEEAGAVGDNMTMNMIHGVLSSIIAKHGGDYEAASKSPEWQVAIKNGEAARQSSISSQQQQAATQQKASGDFLSRIRAKLAAGKGSQPQAAGVSSKMGTPKTPQERHQMGLAKTQKMPEGKLVETIRTLVREALEEVKKNG